MSLMKYRVKEVAADFGMTTKEITEIVGKYFEKPRSNAQALTEEQLNALFDHITQHHQIASIAEVFAVTPPAKKEEKPAEPKKEAAKPAEPAKQEAAKPAEEKPAAPKPEQRKRERRVVDTKAVTVNADRFDDRVDSLVSERVQNYSGGKQKIGNKNKNKGKDNKKATGSKRRNEEQEKLRRLQLEIIKKTPLTVKIPD